MLKNFFAAGLIKIISPFLLKAIIPSVICNKIVSIWFFCVETSLNFSFNSVVIMPNTFSKLLISPFFLFFFSLDSSSVIFSALLISLLIG